MEITTRDMLTQMLNVYEAGLSSMVSHSPLVEQETKAAGAGMMRTDSDDDILGLEQSASPLRHTKFPRGVYRFHFHSFRFPSLMSCSRISF